MRVIALLLVTLLIVVSGFWLARGRAVDAQAELTGATQVAAEAGEPGDAAGGEHRQRRYRDQRITNRQAAAPHAQRRQGPQKGSCQSASRSEVAAESEE